MSLDRAIEAAVLALRKQEYGDIAAECARIAVEAAAPHLMANFVDGDSYDEMVERAERAEAEVERLKSGSYMAMKSRAERAEALADKLAKALNAVLSYHTEEAYLLQRDTLAAWEETRRS